MIAGIKKQCVCWGCGVEIAFGGHIMKNADGEIAFICLECIDAFRPEDGSQGNNVIQHKAGRC